jgi:uncharacterized protein (UPF0333 family)
MSGKKRINPELRIGRGGQVSLELAAVFVCILLLLYGTMKVFVWVNQSLVTRQQDFDDTRVSAASSKAEIQVNEADKNKYPPLKIFGN